jgi:hypothetical protein
VTVARQGAGRTSPGMAAPYAQRTFAVDTRLSVDDTLSVLGGEIARTLPHRIERAEENEGRPLVIAPGLAARRAESGVSGKEPFGVAMTVEDRGRGASVRVRMRFTATDWMSFRDAAVFLVFAGIFTFVKVGMVVGMAAMAVLAVALYAVGIARMGWAARRLRSRLLAALPPPEEGVAAAYR